MQEVPPLNGTIEVPGDKSITHRAILFSALAKGRSEISTVELGRDNFASLRAVSQLGVSVKLALSPEIASVAQQEGLGDFVQRNDQTFCHITLDSPGVAELSAPEAPIQCANSGTTSRLLCGMLAGLPFAVTLDGDDSLRRRPFARILSPLTKMGARVSGESLPFQISGGRLTPLSYRSPISSAQLKSALILAGVVGGCRIEVIEPHRSRDHSERMLSGMGCEIQSEGRPSGEWIVRFDPEHSAPMLSPLNIRVPSDISSAAFFIVAALLSPASSIRMRNLLVNPTRLGVLEILERMGAIFSREACTEVSGEPICELVVRHTALHGIEISGDQVVRAIDEIPIIAVAAAFSEGQTIIRDAAELRVKESDRLEWIARLLSGAGITHEAFEDGICISGNPRKLGAGASVEFDRLYSDIHSCGDHRIAMSAEVLRFLLDGRMKGGIDEISTSFPGFYALFSRLLG